MQPFVRCDSLESNQNVRLLERCIISRPSFDGASTAESEQAFETQYEKVRLLFMDDQSRDRIDHAALFNALWALFVLVHIYKLTPSTIQVSPLLQITHWLLVAAAMFVIFRPKNVWLFLSLIGLQLVSVFLRLPGMANCWMFSGLLAVGIFASYIQLIFKHGMKFSVVEVYEVVAPIARVALIVLYGFVVLAKCNWAFFRIESSCASFFCNLICNSYGLVEPPKILLWSAIPGTLVVEAAIPWLLVRQSTRCYGLVLGLAFHTFISHSSMLLVFDFSAMLLPMYWTFTSPKIMEALRSSTHARFGFWLAKHRRQILPAMALAFMFVIWLNFNFPTNTSQLIHKQRGIVWTLVGGWITVLAFVEFPRMRDLGFAIDKPFGFKSVPMILALTLIVANGLAPYVGLKTGVAYTMFSNLRTEQGYENHLFVPSSCKLFSYQTETVLLLASSEPELQELADANERLLVHDARLKASKFPNATIRYEYQGRESMSTSIASDSLLGKPLSYLERKLLFFRTIPLYNHPHQW